VKAPKIYFRDTGLLHALLDVRSTPHLLTHPRAGASWEGFALEQVLRSRSRSKPSSGPRTRGRSWTCCC
jgi:predicted AAA+ superfamily ATPase